MEKKLQVLKIDASELEVGDYFMGKKVCMITRFSRSSHPLGDSESMATITFEDASTYRIIEFSRLLIERHTEST